MTTAADRAYAEIRDLIVSGTLEPGAPLREEHLAERCAMSRTPIRDALRRLEADHLVVRTPSQRTFVASWSNDDIEEAFLLRGMLEGYAASRAAQHIDAETLAAMHAANRAITAAVTADPPDVGTFLAQNRVFHDLLLEAARSPRLTATLASLIEQPVIHRTAFRYARSELERSAAEHKELLAALEARDPGWAGAVMAAHIRRAFHAFTDARPAG